MYTQGQRDIAREWVSIHYPDVDELEFDKLCAEAIKDIAEIDTINELKERIDNEE